MQAEQQTNTIYARDHFIAKVVIYVVYLSVGIISVEAAMPYLGLIVGTGIWLFGINGTAYLVESVQGHAHNHNIL